MLLLYQYCHVCNYLFFCNNWVKFLLVRIVSLVFIVRTWSMICETRAKLLCVGITVYIKCTVWWNFVRKNRMLNTKACARELYSSVNNLHQLITILIWLTKHVRLIQLLGKNHSFLIASKNIFRSLALMAQWRRRQTGMLMIRGSNHSNSTHSENGYEQATNLKLLVVSQYVIFFHSYLITLRM